jgi:hypothetical protein
MKKTPKLEEFEKMFDDPKIARIASRDKNFKIEVLLGENEKDTILLMTGCDKISENLRISDSCAKEIINLAKIAKQK